MLLVFEKTHAIKEYYVKPNSADKETFSKRCCENCSIKYCKI